MKFAYFAACIPALVGAFTAPAAFNSNKLSLVKDVATTSSAFSNSFKFSTFVLKAKEGDADFHKKKVIILGGDGFCGWPTSLHLSDAGHDVVIVDNLSRRHIDTELGCSSLTPIQSPEVRVQAWKEVSGKDIKFVNLDVAKEYDLLVQLIKTEKPDAIVHFAEQRAAPYSMKNSKAKRYTIDNNVSGSNNLCCAVIDSELDVHIVHLGTMGVYGYGTSGGEIPEGYIDVILPGGRPSTILHPSYPGSVYHATKCLDAILWQFYQKNDELRITDLHQGIVWGTNTPQTARDERLINRFDYDSDYGTVLNRFLMQGAMGVPLTVYGTGGQTRAFIHITDTAKCIEIAINNPPAKGEKVEIFNQVAETRRVRDVAALVAEQTGVKVNNIPNPRQEAAENELDVSNRKFCNLGLEPTTLDTGLFAEVTEIVKKYKSRCDPKKILPASFWNKKRADECATLDPNSVKFEEKEPAKTSFLSRSQMTTAKLNKTIFGKDLELSDEQKQTMEVIQSVKTTERDPRFPTQNQANHCWARYNEWLLCIKNTGDEDGCKNMRQKAVSICPTIWTEKWDEEREGGVFAGLKV